ncbi:MAG: hypothetical protein FJ403_04015 [Verrucomicrobia bacterium]|nr:hypothetical protein [Verrucomicrobiota bacterium]
MTYTIPGWLMPPIPPPPAPAPGDPATPPPAATCPWAAPQSATKVPRPNARERIITEGFICSHSSRRRHEFNS